MMQTVMKVNSKFFRVNTSNNLGEDIDTMKGQNWRGIKVK